MQKVKDALRTSLIYIAIIVLAGGYPTSVFATDAVDPAPITTDQPVATETPPAEPERVYTFNPETNRWDSDKWAYNPSTGNYEAVVVPMISEPAPTITSDPSLQANAVEQPDSSSTATSDTNATIDNGIQSTATTGDATVNSNTTAGNATTGDASAVATIMNMVNSNVSVSGGDFATFVTDIVGDVHGDIMLYPMLLAAMLQAASNPEESTVAVNNDVTITNDVDLTATTGDAAVTNNTTAGNATSGTANTVANVMNIINSIIAANQSFVGTVNIYGSLDGDILIAPDFFPQLLASNANGSSEPGGSLAVSSEDTQSIVNNINLSAATGNALVSSNTSAGSATTGTAATNLVLLNLSGHQIVANDSLLVFVNVLGSWVGLILDAPSGTTAAAIGNGVTTSGSMTPDLSIDVDTNSQIVNNIDLTSTSGDATVAHNTTAGNATTGGATASANIANISGTQMGLTGWFGVLFINVFGDWLGSLGIDTERGNQPTVQPNMTPEQSDVESSTVAEPSNQPFQFIAKQVTSAAKVLPADNTINDQVEVQSQPPVEEGLPVEAVAVSTESKQRGEPIEPKVEEHFDYIPLLTATFITGLGVMAFRNRW
jgi:hypothetical protein